MNIPAISWHRYDIGFQVAQVAVEIQAGVINSPLCEKYSLNEQRRIRPGAYL